MELTTSQIQYLKSIYEISKKGEVKVTKIADFLNYSKPSVIRALKNLSELDFIIYNNHVIKLTEKGLKYSLNITKKDNVLKKFFIEVLGIDEITATNDAENMKNNISCYTIKKLEEYISAELNENISEVKNYCICEFENCNTCKH